MTSINEIRLAMLEAFGLKAEDRVVSIELAIDSNSAPRVKIVRLTSPEEIRRIGAITSRTEWREMVTDEE